MRSAMFYKKSRGGKGGDIIQNPDEKVGGNIRSSRTGTRIEVIGGVALSDVCT